DVLLQEGAADGAAELVLRRGERRVNPLLAQSLLDQRVGEFVAACEPARAEEPEGRAAHAVVARLGDGVADAAGGAPELGRVAGGDDLELLDRLLRDGEREVRALAAADAA